MNFQQVVTYLESLTIMPKTMPGLDKVRAALSEKKWFAALDPNKIIVVAGTNGKGTTCAILESLLLDAKQKVGLYTSPHLIQTTERIRTNRQDVLEDEFCRLFQNNKYLIEKHQLTHFESLTLMAGDYFFAPEWDQNLDYAIFEVGLGGTFDATNVFPHTYSVITALGLDHENILGLNLEAVAQNKFGIVMQKNTVVHHKLPSEVVELKNLVCRQTNSNWIQALHGEACFKDETQTWQIQTPWGAAAMNLVGERACENAMTALTLFEVLKFNPAQHLTALQNVRWHGRMEKVTWAHLTAPVYLSGDHNPQGIHSLLKILRKFNWQKLHLVVGIGQDKSCEAMFQDLLKLSHVELYLTETPFKGRKIEDYPLWVLERARVKNSNVIEILNSMSVDSRDLVVVTGSLYLVGTILKEKARARASLDNSRCPIELSSCFKT